MIRLRTLTTIVLPSLLAGGLAFQSVTGHASAQRSDELLAFWPAASDVTSAGAAKAGAAKAGAAKAGAGAKPPPAPPAPPAAPPVGKAPPAPPTPPAPGAGVRVRMQDGALRIDGVQDLVTGQLDAARKAIRDNPAIPKDARDKVLARLDKVRATVDKRLANLDVTDLDQLGDEMEAMGAEIEAALDGLDDEMAKVAEQLEKDLRGKVDVDVDIDIDPDDRAVMAPGVDLDVDDVDDDLQDAIDDLQDLALRPDQRQAIGKLRGDSDRTVSAAKQRLDALSAQLEAALANPATPDAEIARLVDQVSAQEAAIRKARLLAWSQARRVLDDKQRAKVQGAAPPRTK